MEKTTALVSHIFMRKLVLSNAKFQLSSLDKPQFRIRVYVLVMEHTRK